ncbi:MAG: choline dehydrogenase [Hyphomicrobiales bacterium]|nr:choline dehydrogenase [Hyphomicrobiales bacterium]
MNNKNNPDTEFNADYVIVGAGSAGCVLAARLSENGKHSVIVLEYGGSDFGPLIQMPAALSFPMNMAHYDWGYKSEPEVNLGGRQLVTPRGKVIGGSSSINGMVYVRGHARDFDHWAQSGASGWSFADVLPYFQRMENSADGDSAWRGKSGPLYVRQAEGKNPLFKAFVEAGKQAGFETTGDYNGFKQEGFGKMEQTIWRGQRWSAANAYLKPALKRSNLQLLRGECTKIIFDEETRQQSHNKPRACGIEFKANGKTRKIIANREVILSASSINSPKILMMSGIGPGGHLGEHGIEVIAGRQGVGENLQDHLELYIQQECIQPISLYSSLNLFSKARIGLQWLLFKSGEGATNHFESAAFVRSRAGIEYPDIQFHFLPVAIRYDGKAAAKSHGFQAHVGPMRSKSRGSVRLKSANHQISPSISFNYMSHEEDWSDFRNCIRLTRKIFSQLAFDDLRGEEISPGTQVQSDDELDDYVRQHVESAFHPCGTCKMGSHDDKMAVVDAECRVIGVDGVRVVDSSVFPSITNGNINGPTIMVAEKAADHILNNGILPQSMLDPWIHPNWEAHDQ